jgi:hypothetical protein
MGFGRISASALRLAPWTPRKFPVSLIVSKLENKKEALFVKGEGQE